MAALSFGAALALALWIGAPAPCFFLAVAASCLYGGRGPGFLSIALSALAFGYFFLPARPHLREELFSYGQLALLLAALVMIAAIVGAKRRLEEARWRIGSAKDSAENFRFAGTTMDSAEEQWSNLTIHQAFDEVRKSEDQLRTIVDTIPTLAWSAAPDGCVEFFNRRWLDYTGLPREKARDWAWISALHPDDLDRIVDHWRTKLATGETSEIEGRLRRFDGEYRWFLFRSCPLRDESHVIAKWFGTCTDIEDRRRAEVALKASEESFRLIVDSIPGFVWTLTPAGAQEFVNRQILDYFGRTSLEELNRTLSNGGIHPEDFPPVVAAWRRSIQTGEVLEVDHRLLRADGEYRWFHARTVPMRDAEGRIVRWYGLLTDIDDQKRAEQAIRESAGNFRQIIDGIPGLVHSTTADGKLEFVNRQLVDYAGKPVAEMKDWIELVHPDDRERVQAEFRGALSSGQPWVSEQRFCRADGVYRWFHGRGLPMLDSEGRVVRWCALLTDLEDRKAAKESLRGGTSALA